VTQEVAIMKAVVLRNPGEYGVEHIEKPACPADGLLLRVKFCGLCGSDLRTLISGHRNVRLPAVIGHEVSGIVEEVGADYRGEYGVGDALAVAPNVYCGRCGFCRMGQLEFCENIRELAQQWPGGFAEFMAIPAEALRLGTIQFVPEGLGMEHACVGEPPSSCINAQEKIDVHLGDAVLIIGAGPIGSIHISIARARGAARVFIADINASRLALSEAFGPDATIDSSKVDLVDEIRRLTGGVGPDVVITANAVPITQIQAIAAARKGGRIALFGGLPHDKSIVEVDMNRIHYSALSVIGTTGFAPRHHIQSLELMRSGRIPADKLVTHILPLDDFSAGVDLARAGEAMKVVFQI
jgi:L-iditol 2-dehydrogenase